MESFLTYLAEKKHNLYMKTQKGSLPSRKDDCYKRILQIEQYETVLEIIRMLGPEESTRLREIEKQNYPDAPYL